VGEVDFKVLTSIAWSQAEQEVAAFIDSFKDARGKFALDRFVARLKRCYDAIYNIVEDRSRWFLDSGQKWTLTRPEGYLGEGFQPFLGSNYGGRFAPVLKRLRDRFREQGRRVLHADSGDEGRWLPKMADWYRVSLDSKSVTALLDPAAMIRLKKRLDSQQL